MWPGLLKQEYRTWPTVHNNYKYMYIRNKPCFNEHYLNAVNSPDRLDMARRPDMIAPIAHYAPLSYQINMHQARLSDQINGAL